MIDWKRVGELREEVGAEDFVEVVDIFLEEVDEVVARLRGGVDPATYEAELHFLKGSALNLGFEALGALCANAEKTAAGGHAADADIAAVVSGYAASKAEFLSRLGLLDDAA